MRYDAHISLGGLWLDPVLPESYGELHISNAPMGNGRITIDIIGSTSTVHGLPEGLTLHHGQRPWITELVEKAHLHRPESPSTPLRVQAIEIPAEDLQRRSVTVESHSILAERLGVAGATAPAAVEGRPAPAPPLFASAEERTVAEAAVHAIDALSHRPADLPGAALLRRPDIQARVVEAVKASYQQQLTLEGVREPVDVEQVVATVCAEVADATIDIPRVLVVPIGKVESGFNPFTLDLSSVRYPPVSEELWIQHLRSHEREVLLLARVVSVRTVSKTTSSAASWISTTSRTTNRRTSCTTLPAMRFGTSSAT
jgi:hypothetical protein